MRGTVTVVVPLQIEIVVEVLDATARIDEVARAARGQAISSIEEALNSKTTFAKSMRILQSKRK